MSVFDREDFKKLKRKYYKRLKDQLGFKDIENEKGDLIDHQNVFDFSQRINFKKDLFESTRNYYSWASEMIYHGNFQNDVDKMIWSLHADGKSSRKISAVVRLEFSWVCRKIKEIRAYLETQYTTK